MNKLFYTLIPIVLLTACSFSQNSTVIEKTYSSSFASSIFSEQSSSATVLSMHGIVKTVGITVYMEGSHKLELEDGTFILLKSNSVDLNGYVNESVMVSGIVNSTVEADGLIMTVEKIQLYTASSESFSSSEISSMASSSISTESSSSSVALISSSVTSIISSSKSSILSSVEAMQPVEPIPTVEPSIISAFASKDYSAARWTSEYCSPIEPFCIPIHKNFWYQAFRPDGGESLSIEISSSEIKNKGEGLIIVRLVPGVITNDKGVVQSGNQTIGYRTWTNNRHFEIYGDSSLVVPISYITQNLKAVSAE